MTHRRGPLPDFSQGCEKAVLAIWGEPDRKTPKQYTWRGEGDGYSRRTYDPRKHSWYDAGLGRGGSTLELVFVHLHGEAPPEKIRGKDFIACWKWAHEHNVIPQAPPDIAAGDRNSFKGRAVIRRHRYEDEDGTHLQDVCRLDTDEDDLRFRPQLPDGTWKAAKKQVPYRLPQLLATPLDQVVLYTEGERDSDAAASLGFAATTHAGGVFKYPKRFNKYFQNRDVVVVGDNDTKHQKGQENAQQITTEIATVAKRVRVLIAPDGFKDISEWVKADGTREQLDALIEAAPEFTKPEPEPTPEPSPPDVDVELERLARMSEWDFERARAEAAKALGVSASFLRTARKLKRAELGLDDKNGRQGRQYEFPRIEPWPTAVDGAALLDEITTTIRRHVIMPSHTAEAIALWVVHTHVVERFLISPRLALRSVTKQCGKTTTLDIIARMVRRPLPTVNTSPAAMFRMIESDQPTLLIDEADTFLNDNEELRGVINSGHRQGGCVLRVEGDQHEARAFATYAPCAIAAIGSMPGTIMDRSVIVDLARRKPDERIEAFRLDRTAALDEIARRIVRWAEDNADAVGALDPEIPPGLYNRAADNWRPLFQIADVAGNDWPQRARAASLSGAPDIDEVSRLELLLGDVRDIFDALLGDLLDKAQRIGSAEMIEKLCAIEPRPWSEYGKSGKAITQNQLARLLKPLGIAPVQIRVEGEKTRGYERAQFEEAFARYLASEGVSNRYSGTNADRTGTSGTSGTGTAEKPVPDGKCEKSNNDGLCTGVPVAKGGNGRGDDKGLSDRDVEDIVAWAVEFRWRHKSEAALIQALHDRLLRRHNVFPSDLEAAVNHIMDRVPRPPPDDGDQADPDPVAVSGHLIWPEPPDTICAHCGKADGQVYLYRCSSGAFGAFSAEQLHEACVSPFNRANRAKPRPRLSVVGDCPPDTICLHCHQAGGVKRIKDASVVGGKAETLHEGGCAEAWFEKIAGEKLVDRDAPDAA
jgi:hypothetical protein